MKRLLNLVVVAFVFISTLLITNDTFARRYSRSYTKNVINKTAYIIDQAYDIAYTYDYWTEHNLSKAVYYNDYAYDLYRRKCLSAAVHYSLKARQYALIVIDNCDDYWEYFYFNYFGWSISFGYNPNFAYASGYANGYYDGYYAAYCNRHGHNPHHNHGHQPPHHNGHNPSHGNVKPTNGHVIGRGETGATNPNITTGSGVISRASFKNINYEEYFTAEELKDIKDIPNDDALENNFKKERPNVKFDSKELAKPNNEVMRRTKEISKDYEKENNEKGQTSITRQIVPTATLTKEVQTSINKETKPVTNGAKPITNGKNIEPKNEKPLNRDITTPVKETKPANKDVKPTTNKDVKPNKETKPANKETKPANKDVKPTTDKGVKPSKETKPTNKEMKPSNNKKTKTTTSKSTKNTKTNNKTTKPSKNTKSTQSNKATKSTNTKAKTEKKINR